MAGKFLAKSRHGTIYYFRRRVPLDAQDVLGRDFLVQSLQTSDKRIPAAEIADLRKNDPAAEESAQEIDFDMDAAEDDIIEEAST